MIDNFTFKDRYTCEDLVHIVTILRSPGGCPWDREQTHESIRKNFIEETYEAIEAIDKASPEMLREELGFDGVVLCDDLYMGAITQFTGGQNAAVQAVLAGNDLVCCSDYEASCEAIAAAVYDGTLTEARLDESVLRILRWKLFLGLDIFA